jgi:hypothetical protein
LREKYDICGKFLGISGKFFSYLRKNVIYPENFFWYVPKKCLRPPPESAPQSLPPQLLEASYAPGTVPVRGPVRIISY